MQLLLIILEKLQLNEVFSLICMLTPNHKTILFIIQETIKLHVFKKYIDLKR